MTLKKALPEEIKIFKTFNLLCYQEYMNGYVIKN